MSEIELPPCEEMCTMNVAIVTKTDADGVEMFAVEIGRVTLPEGTEPGHVIEFARKEDVALFAHSFKQSIDEQLADL